MSKLDEILGWLQSQGGKLKPPSPNRIEVHPDVAERNLTARLKAMQEREAETVSLSPYTIHELDGSSRIARAEAARARSDSVEGIGAEEALPLLILILGKIKIIIKKKEGGDAK